MIEEIFKIIVKHGTVLFHTKSIDISFAWGIFFLHIFRDTEQQKCNFRTYVGNNKYAPHCFYIISLCPHSPLNYYKEHTKNDNLQ